MRFGVMKAHRSMSRRFSLDAYTLMEIMLVLAIISVLVGAGIYSMTGSLDMAKERRVDADIQTITTALRSYEMENLFLPTTAQGLNALVKRPASEPQPKRWRQGMKKIVDPWGSIYQYKYPGVKNSDSFDIYSLGPDRVESKDDIGNWEREGN
jgi:general secretion pathway protein G